MCVKRLCDLRESEAMIDCANAIYIEGKNSLTHTHKKTVLNYLL